ncbi:hypothetical protein MSTE_00864 [Mycobacteroides stephanolepidis]|uniref:ER-bound oxygenase mpaB/mpaB'/Rubber oxygenase catalytic domain-containing protein n=1 Tax=[Mycobacterium] stephanolepidis TaxID=1520670 RepID=A0A1Z4ETB6_9MYCO|nr:oxygenase MpaB family protein [[Mycobacterium] stephanolepidis]BAX96199.1 hypothetical protein MSTE_00864 [[Mycobacterium] stephanolepidis]
MTFGEELDTEDIGPWLSLAPPGDPEHGYFGPDSVPWRLFSHPCVVAGAVYNAVIFELYPPCATLSDQVDSLYVDPIGRARRTLGYVYSVIFGATATADRAAKYVRAMHDSISPLRDGDKLHWVSDPENLLWLHMTNGDGALRAHAAYGEGELSSVEQDDFWRQLAPFAQLQGVPPELIPMSAAEAEAYFARMWPQLKLTDAGQRAFSQVMNPQGLSAQWKPVKLPLALVVRSGVALLPNDVLHMIGLDSRSPALTVARRVARGGYWLLDQPGARDVLPAVALPRAVETMRAARSLA